MRGVFLTAALVLLALACACGRPQRTEATGPSLYELVVPLTDERGAPAGFDVHRGHPTVVAMFYASCPTVCPLTISHIQELEGRLTAGERADLRVLLVSFDPDHDTPLVLQGIATAHKLDLQRWTLATGTADDVRQIAAVLGVSYKRQPDGSFVHDAPITVLDREGRVAARIEDADVTPLASAIHGMGHAP